MIVTGIRILISSKYQLTIMGGTENEKFSFSVFLNFSFLGEKWGTRNEKSIFFIFCPILAKIRHFLMIFQSIMVTVNILLAFEAFLGCFVALFLDLGIGSWTVWGELRFGTFSFPGTYQGKIFSFFLVSRREMAQNFSFLARNQNARKMPPILNTY